MSVGFVPTMGAIHAGHLSLISEAAKTCDITICSIFVNPTQFNDPDDYEKYPVCFDEDIRKLTEAGTNILFLPSVSEIYEKGTRNLETYPFGKLEQLLEGAFRTGHFQGVGQVMSRLLKIILPDKLFMGQKDFQQTLIVNRLLELHDIKTALVICPILREKDGLAMSSRNVRLSAEARKKAPLIYHTLQFVKANFSDIPLDRLLEEAIHHLEDNGFKVDYLVIADENLNLIEHHNNKKTVCLTAVWIEGIRLIDNLILN